MTSRKPFVPPVTVSERDDTHLIAGHRPVYRDSDGAFIGTIKATRKGLDGSTVVETWPAPQFVDTYPPSGRFNTYQRPVDALDALLEAASAYTVEQLGTRTTDGWTWDQWRNMSKP